MKRNKNKFGISERSYYLLIELFNKHPEIEKVIIFGSRALGNAKSGSDIDLAIIGENIESDFIRELEITINEKLNIPYFVDIIYYNTIENSELKKHIDDEGKIFWLNPGVSSLMDKDGGMSNNKVEGE